jgi:hypothetical protein
VPQVKFTQHLERFLTAPAVNVPGGTVREALDRVFGDNPRLRSYLLDDQGRLRKHVVIFLDGQQIKDRIELSDSVRPESELLVMQALSGG